MLRSGRINDALSLVVSNGITSALLVTVDGELLGCYNDKGVLGNGGEFGGSDKVEVDRRRRLLAVHSRTVGAICAAAANDYKTAGSDVLSTFNTLQQMVDENNGSGSGSDNNCSSGGSDMNVKNLSNNDTEDKNSPNSGPFKMMLVQMDVPVDSQAPSAIYAIHYCDVGSYVNTHEVNKGGNPETKTNEEEKEKMEGFTDDSLDLGGRDTQLNGRGGNSTSGHTSTQHYNNSAGASGGYEVGDGGYYVAVIAEEGTLLGVVKSRLEALAGYVEESLSSL